PDVLQPRRHPSAGDGAAAHQAGLPRRRPRDRQRRAAGPPARGARVRGRPRPGAGREDPAREPAGRRAAAAAPRGDRLALARCAGGAVRDAAPAGCRGPRGRHEARRGGPRGRARGARRLRPRRGRRGHGRADLRHQPLRCLRITCRRLPRRGARARPGGPDERTTLMNDMTTLQLLLWVVYPYMVLAVFVLGHVWRFKADRFGWTTRSSQIYESKLLSIGSPLFHYGIIGIFFGHVVGLGIPKSWTRFLGISDHVYHLMAVTIGLAAAAACVGGLMILLYRRRTNVRVFGATTAGDKLMYLLLAATI